MCRHTAGPPAARSAGQPYRIALLNPNTSRPATERMLESARSALPQNARIEGFNVQAGDDFIANPRALAQAARQVELRAGELVASGFDAIIVAAFGDPGLQALRARWPLPMTGLGEAGIAEAARGGLRYAIVTVTPELHDSLVLAAQTIAPAAFAGVRYTRGGPAGVMQTPEALAAALLAACHEAVQLDGAQSIVIGGGPLAQAARGIAAQLPVRVVDPVQAAVRLACLRGGLSCAA